MDCAGCSEDSYTALAQRSQFNLFHDIGLQFFGGDSGRATRFASHLVAKCFHVEATDIIRLAIAQSSGRSKSCNAVPSSFFGYTFLRQCQKGVLSRSFTW